MFILDFIRIVVHYICHAFRMAFVGGTLYNMEHHAFKKKFPKDRKKFI